METVVVSSPRRSQGLSLSIPPSVVVATLLTHAFSVIRKSFTSGMCEIAKGEIIRSAVQRLSLGRSRKQTIGAWVRILERQIGGSSTSRIPNRVGLQKVIASDTLSPKAGIVGADRFKDGAVPGTYWNDSLDSGEEVTVRFNAGSNTVTVSCRAGENVLRVAERCEVTVPNIDFCFEGSCWLCEMEVVGGATEVGYQADTSGSDLIRSCMCPVPRGRGTLEINLLSKDEVWGEGVL